MSKDELIAEIKERASEWETNQAFTNIELEDLGFTKTDRLNKNSARLADLFFEYSISEKEKIEIRVWSYDQSQAFSIQKDMNKLTINVITDGAISESYSYQYED